MRASALLVVAAAACGGRGNGPPAGGDRNKLFVQVTAEGSHDDALRAGAMSGLSAVSYAVPVGHGGDVELQVELSSLNVIGNQTTCNLKIMIMRLPTHDLLGIADGGARAAGTDDRAVDDCIAGLGETLVRGKVRRLFERQLAAKR